MNAHVREQGVGLNTMPMLRWFGFRDAGLSGNRKRAGCRRFSRRSSARCLRARWSEKGDESPFSICMVNRAPRHVASFLMLDSSRNAMVQYLKWPERLSGGASCSRPTSQVTAKAIIKRRRLMAVGADKLRDRGRMPGVPAGSHGGRHDDRKRNEAPEETPLMTFGKMHLHNGRPAAPRLSAASVSPHRWCTWQYPPRHT